MIKVLLSDFSDVLLFNRVSSYRGSLNALHARQAVKPNYLFFDYFALNQVLLEYYLKLKQQFGMKIAMYTSGTMQESKELAEHITPVFDQVISAGRVGKPKSDPDSYTWILQQLKVKGEEVIFIDDSELNIEAAKEVGIHAIQYTSNEDLMSVLLPLIK